MKKLFKIFGYSPKYSFIFYCKAENEADAKNQFDAVIEEDTCYGPMLWDYKFFNSAPEEKPVNLLLSSVWHQKYPLDKIEHIPHRAHEISVSEVIFNVIEDYP